MVHVKKFRISGESNIGLMIYANDKFALVPKSINKKELADVEEVLKVPCHKVSIAGTPLIGVFLNGTEDKIIIPEIIFEKELKELESIGKKYNVEFTVFNTELTCFGNNMLISGDNAIVNPDYTNDEIKELKNILGINVKIGMIADIEIVGATTVINNNQKKALIHRDASNEDIKTVEETFGVKVDTGTVNIGSPYVKSGIVSNKNGFLIGEESGGPEITNADEVLGYLK